MKIYGSTKPDGEDRFMTLRTGLERPVKFS